MGDLFKRDFLDDTKITLQTKILSTAGCEIEKYTSKLYELLEPTDKSWRRVSPSDYCTQLLWGTYYTETESVTHWVKSDRFVR